MLRILLILFLIGASQPIQSMQKIDKKEIIETFKRIKKKHRKEYQVIFSYVGWGLWLGMIILFTYMIGLKFLLMFLIGLVVLFLIVTIIYLL